MVASSKSNGVLDQRDAVLPEDIKQLAQYTAAHRLHCNDGSDPSVELSSIIEQTQVL